MIRFEHVSKRYPDGTSAVDDLSFEVREGELVTLVGPSGCGKTTTMKMVNRLIEPTAGRILLDGEDVAGLDPVALRRRIGYVIQQVGLFPHKTVLENTATVPALLGWPRRKARERAAELLALVGLDPTTHGGRYPDRLSGGQRQRVGVARALAADPPVLLMDEPFGAVDPVVRERLQSEFLRLQQRFRKTVLFVTHDLEEAVRLGDRIAVYGAGRIEQFDTPATVLGAPAGEYVADFVGADRALKRLAVTPIDPADLVAPVRLRPDEPAERAAGALREAGADWAVALDGAGRPHGWVAAEALRDGLVRDHLRPLDGVPLHGSLRQALGAILQRDTGWIAVLDGAAPNPGTSGDAPAADPAGAGADGGRLVGVLTLERLHQALRRSIGATAPADAAADAAS